MLDESMISGETMPVSKSPIVKAETRTIENLLDRQENCIIYGGTKCLEAHAERKEGLVRACVIRTGFSSYKGALVLGILYFKTKQFSFLKDSFKYIAIFSLLAILGFSVTIHRKVEFGKSSLEIFLECLDLITIAVPPLLPLAMQSGIELALKRSLKFFYKISYKHKIFITLTIH